MVLFCVTRTIDLRYILARILYNWSHLEQDLYRNNNTSLKPKVKNLLRFFTLCQNLLPSVLPLQRLLVLYDLNFSFFIPFSWSTKRSIKFRLVHKVHLSLIPPYHHESNLLSYTYHWVSRFLLTTFRNFYTFYKLDLYDVDSNIGSRLLLIKILSINVIDIKGFISFYLHMYIH